MNSKIDVIDELYTLIRELMIFCILIDKTVPSEGYLVEFFCEYMCKELNYYSDYVRSMNSILSGDDTYGLSTDDA